MVVTLAKSAASVLGISTSRGLAQSGCSSLCCGIISRGTSFASVKFESSWLGYARVPYPNIKCSFDGNGRGKYAVSAMRNYAESNSGNSLPPEFFWHSLFNDVIRSLKSIFIFLWEQPGQLKCIEWPSFQSTLKTATLTLVLMAVFIVVLSGVDAVLRILLGFTLRKKDLMNRSMGFYNYAFCVSRNVHGEATADFGLLSRQCEVLEMWYRPTRKSN